MAPLTWLLIIGSALIAAANVANALWSDSPLIVLSVSSAGRLTCDAINKDSRCMYDEVVKITKVKRDLPILPVRELHQLLVIETRSCGKMVLEKASRVDKSTCPYRASQAIPWDHVLPKFKDSFNYLGSCDTSLRIQSCSITVHNLLTVMGPDYNALSDNIQHAVKRAFDAFKFCYSCSL